MTADDPTVRLAVLETRLEERERALELQAAEYTRRLDDLNHAHQQREERDRDYIMREVFEASQVAETTARQLAFERQDDRLKSLENWRSRASGVAVVVALFAGAVGAAIMKVLGG